MPFKNRIMPFLLVLVLTLLLQAGFIQMECHQTPSQVATEFAQAYFHLDSSAAEHLCAGASSEQGEQLIAAYLRQRQEDAADRGFGTGMIKSNLFHIKTDTVQKSDTEAEVHLSAARRTAINPVFFIVGKFFDLGRTFHIEETIKMCKEDGLWKVCPPVFDLADS